MKEIWKKHKLVIISAGYALVAFLVFYFAAMPFVGKIVSKSDEIQEKIMDGDINKKKLDKIGELESEYGYYQQNKSSLNVILDENDQVSFIKKLENLAEETGNSITLKAGDDQASAAVKSNASDKKKKDEDKTIQEKLAYGKYFSMQISLKGNYEGLVRFIHKLENSTYYINVISLSSKKETEKEDVNGSKNNSQVGSIFMPSSPKPEDGAQGNEAKEKEFLNSTINIIVYTKK